MGARQSKRSVDITTATGAGPESGGEVVAGKLGKLEDGVVTPETVAPKQNGDAVLKASDETVAVASGDVTAENAAKEEKPVTNAEEKPKAEDVPVCKKLDSPVTENVSEKPLIEAAVQQVCEKPKAPKAEIVCEKPNAPEKVCEEPTAVEPASIEQVKVETPAVLDAVSESVVTEIVKTEQTPKPEAVIESSFAEKPEKKQDEETLSPASAADEKQNEVTSNEQIAEVSATESTQSEESNQVPTKPVTKEVDEKIPGMIMLDDVPPVEIPLTENSVAVAEN